ncbi:E-selectin-like [Dendronephthya gigantea]|uniref:E-selectin-like n=1 Tax=Dendronephthya gigantea TaxID=151771 RepID=UPI00106BF37C|nr:E-selectin-like [Dendronephthya gigantea]
MKSCGVILVALILVFMKTPVHSAVSRCPQSTWRFGSTCYSFQTSKKTWVEANKSCKILGGQLATIDRYSLNQFLFNHWQKKRVWIGIKKSNSKWCYPDGKPSPYLRWNTGEPNNVGGNEDCVEMWENGHWNDAPCTLARPFICEIPAADIDECALGTANCHYDATCVNTLYSYTCTCNTGYTGNGTVCSDVNECTSSANSCHSVANCLNTDGSYTCTCPVGYIGDGKNCNQIQLSYAHNKILEELKKHDRAVDKRLSSMEHFFQRFLGRRPMVDQEKPITSGP